MARDKYEKGKAQKRTVMGRKGEKDATSDRAVRADTCKGHLSRDLK